MTSQSFKGKNLHWDSFCKNYALAFNMAKHVALHRPLDDTFLSEPFLKKLCTGR